VLRPEHSLILNTLLDHLDRIEMNWGDVEELYNASPRSLIHGDFVRKNLRVRASANTLSLGVFDWEIAGWGLSAIDLVQELGKSADPELEVYYSIIGNSAARIGTPFTKESLELGVIFRLLAAISWTSDFLRFEWIESAIVNLQLFKDRLDTALGATGLAKSTQR
jgi:Ser/Thr protein kinase RdoA (MazF antagonist)